MPLIIGSAISCGKRETREWRSSDEVSEPYGRFLAGLYRESLTDLDGQLANEYNARRLAAARESC